MDRFHFQEVSLRVQDRSVEFHPIALPYIGTDPSDVYFVSLFDL